MSEAILKRDSQLRFDGRILFLTEDTSLIRRQLEARADEAKALEDELAGRLVNDDLPLMSNISTDEITPGWVCFYYDETLGQYVYIGMREGAVKKDIIRKIEGDPPEGDVGKDQKYVTVLENPDRSFCGTRRALWILRRRRIRFRL